MCSDKFTYPSCLHELNGKGHRYGRSRGRQRIIHPHSFSSLSRSGVLSDSGNCKTYRDDADGYCRADFSGAVVLKRLDDAITSITTSDAAAQERLFHKVLRKACVTPEDISYVEINGTGTQVGDKAEMGAVSSVFSKRRDGELLPVGAIKANIGHSGAVSNRRQAQHWQTLNNQRLQECLLCSRAYSCFKRVPYHHRQGCLIPSTPTFHP